MKSRLLRKSVFIKAALKIHRETEVYTCNAISRSSHRDSQLLTPERVWYSIIFVGHVNDVKNTNRAAWIDTQDIYEACMQLLRRSTSRWTDHRMRKYNEIRKKFRIMLLLFAAETCHDLKLSDD